jgi:hypothetical protein
VQEYKNYPFGEEIAEKKVEEMRAKYMGYAPQKIREQNKLKILLDLHKNKRVGFIYVCHNITVCGTKG